MTARQDCSGFRNLAEGACHDFMEHFRLQSFGGKHGEVETCHRPATHSINVTDGIGCRNLAEGERIVDRRRYEIRGRNEGDLVGESVNTGIIAGLKAHEKVRVLYLRNLRQKFAEPDRVQLGCSPTGL